jgi:DNA-binding response OmpR family regulator
MRVLIVEDSITVAIRLIRICNEEGFEHVCQAVNMKEAESFIALHSFDLAIVDVMLADGAIGIPIARNLRKAQPKCPIVLCSSDNFTLTARSMRATFVQKGILFPERIRDVIRSMKGETR